MAVNFPAPHRNGVMGIPFQIERDIGLTVKQLRHGSQIHGFGFAVLRPFLHSRSLNTALTAAAFMLIPLVKFD
jgi:hypothetical protein